RTPGGAGGLRDRHSRRPSRRERQGHHRAARRPRRRRGGHHRMGARAHGRLQGAARGRVQARASTQRHRQGAVARAAGSRRWTCAMSGARELPPVVEATGWRWGPFTFRLPFLHTRPHLPELLQGTLVATATGLALVPILTGYFGMSFEEGIAT